MWWIWIRARRERRLGCGGVLAGARSCERDAGISCGRRPWLVIRQGTGGLEIVRVRFRMSEGRTFGLYKNLKWLERYRAFVGRVAQRSGCRGLMDVKMRKSCRPSFEAPRSLPRPTLDIAHRYTALFTSIAHTPQNNYLSPTRLSLC